jgi:anti-anti-sigma factor
MLENHWTIFDCTPRADPGVLVELVGEIDVRYRRLIEDALSLCLVSQRSKLVDLSELKFMYSGWVRVLAFRYQRGGGRMPLSDAS